VGNSGATEIGSGALQDDEASEDQTDSRGKVFKVKSGIGVANSHGNGAENPRVGGSIPPPRHQKNALDRHY
jgi:hypothetical protein